MPGVSMASTKNSVDGSVKKRIFDFLQKLQEDDTRPGLHIEPMQQAQDPRVRTGRVTDEWRAVLYKMSVHGEPHYVYYGTWHHDEAIRIARTTVLRLNPALGVPEFDEWAEPEPDPTPAPAQAPEQPVTSPERGEQPESESPQGEGRSAGDEPEAAAQAHSAVVEPEWTNQLAGEWTAEALHEQAGINQRLAAQALQARSLAEFTAVVDDAPEAQGLVLLGMSSGDSLEQVLTDLDMGPADESQGDEDQRVLSAIQGGSVGFTYVGESSEELQTALESLDIDRWRVFLHPEQRRYAEGDWKGSYRLSGGAGTGKTVVLLHRARHLHEETPQARVLLTTFTRTLADSLGENFARLDPETPHVGLGEPGVAVFGLDQVAARVVKQATPDEVQQAVERVLGAGRNTLEERVMRTEEAFREAVERAAPDLPEELLTPAFLEQEYIAVVLGNLVTDERGYVRAPRSGRGTALNRRARQELWKVFAQFRRSHQFDDKVTFPELTVIAAQILNSWAEAGKQLPVDHVLADEAQDFHPGHWMLCRALAAEGPNDLFIAEDSHQRIYGQKVTLSRYGIHIRGRSRRLRLNYRTTAENLAYAVSLLAGAEYTDMEGEQEWSNDYRSVRSGPAPVVAQAAGLDGEVDVVAERVQQWLADGHRSEAIGVLVRSRQMLQRVITEFENRGVTHEGMPVRLVDARSMRRLRAGEIGTMTMHNAKGMEFECVAVMGVGARDLPATWALKDLPEAERDDAVMRERSVLYVAASRARDELVVTWSGERSELLTE